MKQDSPIRVFISYAKEDYNFAKNLYNDLKCEKIDPWIDNEDLLIGQDWKLSIEKAIQECNFFCALLSNNSVSKVGYVQKELKMALELLDNYPKSEIFILPIRIDNCEPTENKLLELHFVDLFPSYTDGLTKIKNVILRNMNKNLSNNNNIIRVNHLKSRNLFQMDSTNNDNNLSNSHIIDFEKKRKTIVPTILVGLGGIGTKIVEKVYLKLSKNERNKMIVHIFDTNIYDINKTILPDEAKTLLSNNMNITSHLQDSNKQVYNWFPYEIDLLKTINTKTGSGQIRCISRLVYNNAIKEGKLLKFEDQISKFINSKTELNNYTYVNVMIVSSLAGGTGAGIFLQIALYLRYFLEVTLKNSVNIRGAFLLPDVFIHTREIQEHQWDIARANAYACIKELDFITKKFNRQANDTYDSSSTIELEYIFDQLNNQIQKNINQLPYDFCYLYDYLSTKGEQIGHFSNYLDQMINIIYLQLFSPMCSNISLMEENYITQIIKGGDGNRYCSAGIATLTYPYDEIVKYIYIINILSNLLVIAS